MNDMNCPICSHELTCRPSNPQYKSNEEVTQIYICPECPFIGLEYFEKRNVDDLIAYLNIGASTGGGFIEGECVNCGNPIDMFWCDKCEKNSENEKCECGRIISLDGNYHVNCNK